MPARPIRPQRPPSSGQAQTPPLEPQALQQLVESATHDPPFKTSPCFHEHSYNALPPLLAEGCNAFQGQRERDVFLMAAMTVLSGCMPAVRGNYDGAEVRANLFAFVVAPAGSGKGALTWARIMGVALHKAKTQASEQAKQGYEQRMADSRASKQPISERAPPYQSLYLPGNSSAAAIIKALQENNQTGIICETEADSLSGALKQEWGDYSDLMRKGFHHEAITYMRKSGERYELDYPAMSVVLAGTPGQVKGLIPNSENGLFSRFLFYCFENEPVWRDVSPHLNRPSLNQHFGELADEVNKMAQALERVGNITFHLQPKHWQYINEGFPEWLLDAIEDTATAFSSNVFRMGLILYRMAMVLTVLQAYSRGTLTNTLVCEDTDFGTAMDMAKVLLAHSKLMYASLPGAGGKLLQGEKCERLLQLLPASFDRSTADEVGRNIGVMQRSVTNYLQRLTRGGQVRKLQHGQYQKC